MLGSFKKSPEHLEALDRVKEWTRERFTLSQDTVILVSEIACSLPGCPPLETVVAFWTEGDDQRAVHSLRSPQEVHSRPQEENRRALHSRWSPQEVQRRHHFKIFKPVEEVVNDDLPVYWMIDALVVPDGIGCECC
jgi:nitrate reductase delta subunit